MRQFAEHLVQCIDSFCKLALETMIKGKLAYPLGHGTQHTWTGYQFLDEVDHVGPALLSSLPAAAVATIVLRTCAAETSIDVIEAAGLQDAEESVRDRWARLVITVNELALPALCLNLPGLDIDGAHLSPGEPVHLSLRTLLRRPSPTWHVAQRDVFVCENPNIVAIVAIAADRLGAACAPLACTDGMPCAAEQSFRSQA